MIGINFSKKEDFYEEQIDTLKAKIKSEEYGSEVYKNDMKYLEYLQEESRKTKNDKKNIDWKGILGIVIAGGGLIVNTMLTIRGQNLTKATAELAYTKDEEMSLCNNKLWNLRKDYPNKVDSSKII